MTFLELCQRVFDEGDRAPYTLTTTDIGTDDVDEQVYKIIGWVKQAYTEIQQWNKDFTFFHRSGTFLTTEVDVEDYRKAGVRSVIKDSLYCRRPGEVNGWPLQYLTYKQWRDAYQNINIQAGTPHAFVELPNRTFRIVPEASEVFDVSCDWFTRRDTFVADDDEPIWDEDDHEIIVWVALKYYMSEYETPEELGVKAAQGLRFAKKQFLDQYLPEFGVVGGFA